MSKPEQKFRGLVHVYTGDGKGKTTAALGLALRATGQGLRVCFLQFMKGNRKCGEHLAVERAARCAPFFDIICPNDRSYFRQSIEERVQRVKETMNVARQLISSRQYSLVVLDEAVTAVGSGLVTSSEVLDIISNKPADVELVLTGRGAPIELIEAADLVTEMVMLKHPYKRGIKARKGIEY